MKHVACWLARAALVAAGVSLTLVPRSGGAQVMDDAFPLLDRDQNAPGVRWRQIETPHYRLVFPAELEADAQRVANTLERGYAPTSQSLGRAPRRISVILANQAATSNAYVALGPRRSVWLGTPPQESGLLGTGEWYTLLAAHETRHVAQQDRVNTGFVRVASTLFGDVWQAAASYFSVPLWWWEGDAVGTETALTRAGRGRLPEFDMEIRTIVLSGGRFDYYRAYQRSYRDWHPNHYPLGYLLTTHVKREHGPDAWERVVRRTARTAFLPGAFSRALDRETGRSASETYDATVADLRSRWQRQLDAVTLTEARALSRRRKRAWTNLRYPQYAADGAVIAERWGLDDRYTLVRIDPDGGETDLGVALRDGGPVSVAGSVVAWAEVWPDPRWGQRDYSVIRLYDMRTRRARTLTRRSKLFGPALSPDARRVASVEFTADRRCAVVVLDAATGVELRRVPSPDNEFIAGLSWSPHGDELVMTRQGTRGKALSLLRLATGAFRDVLPHGSENVARPVRAGRHVFYGSNVSGIDNVYAVDVETGRRHQVTSRRYGAFYPAVSPDGTRLAFSDYTPGGFDAVEAAIDTARWTPIERVADGSVRYYAPLVAQEGGGGAVYDSVPADRRAVADYAAARRLLAVHSWYALGQPDGRTAALGVTSSNELNTAAAQLGYEYDRNERTNAATAAVSYGGWYPILELGGRYGDRSAVYAADRGTGADVRHRWRESTVRGGVRVPLDFGRGAYSQLASFGVHAAAVRVAGATGGPQFGVGGGVFAPVTYEAALARATGWIRNVRPAWGQQLRLRYSHTPLGGDYAGSLLSAQGALLVPGLARNHSARAALAHETQGVGGYRYASEIRFPRGYTARFEERLTAGSLSYALPLATPDWSLGSALYVRRLAANAFYDHAVGRTGAARRDYRSAGLELTAETTPLNLPPSVRLDVGARYVRPLDGGAPRLEVIFGFGG